MGARGLMIRDDVGAAELRRFAQGEADRCAALRALAIAQALEGASRAEAARLVARERQSLRDVVVRFNAEGLAGLRNRPRPGRPGKLSRAQPWCTDQPLSPGKLPSCFSRLCSAWDMFS